MKTKCWTQGCQVTSRLGLCGFLEHSIIALKVQGKNIKATSGWAGISQGKGCKVEPAAKREQRSLWQVGEETGDGDRGWVEGKRRPRPEKTRLGVPGGQRWSIQLTPWLVSP